MPAWLPERVNKVFSSVAPRGLPGVTLTGGKNATEHAIMDAMKVRGQGKVLGFAGSNHGQGLAMSKFAHPSMSLNCDWPVL